MQLFVRTPNLYKEDPRGVVLLSKVHPNTSLKFRSRMVTTVVIIQRQVLQYLLPLLKMERYDFFSG
jgi:hypothetical protein